MTPDELVVATRAAFAFLLEAGYEEPKVSGTGRERTVVYWGKDGRANVAIYHDGGSPPWVQIVPLSATRADGSTRTFGLNEAATALAPELPPPQASAPAARWLEWYARILREHFDAVTRPRPPLLDRIEGRRDDTA